MLPPLALALVLVLLLGVAALPPSLARAVAGEGARAREPPVPDLQRQAQGQGQEQVHEQPTWHAPDLTRGLGMYDAPLRAGTQAARRTSGSSSRDHEQHPHVQLLRKDSELFREQVLAPNGYTLYKISSISSGLEPDELLELRISHSAVNPPASFQVALFSWREARSAWASGLEYPRLGGTGSEDEDPSLARGRILQSSLREHSATVDVHVNASSISSVLSQLGGPWRRRLNTNLHTLHTGQSAKILVRGHEADPVLVVVRARVTGVRPPGVAHSLDTPVRYNIVLEAKYLQVLPRSALKMVSFGFFCIVFAVIFVVPMLGKILHTADLLAARHLGTEERRRMDHLRPGRYSE